MRNLVATICLIFAVLVGNAGVSWGAEIGFKNNKAT
jgi:hypothetical protein